MVDVAQLEGYLGQFFAVKGIGIGMFGWLIVLSSRKGQRIAVVLSSLFLVVQVVSLIGVLWLVSMHNVGGPTWLLCPSAVVGALVAHGLDRWFARHRRPVK